MPNAYLSRCALVIHKSKLAYDIAFLVVVSVCLFVCHVRVFCQDE